jgi:hypothetical protein
VGVSRLRRRDLQEPHESKVIQFEGRPAADSSCSSRTEEPSLPLPERHSSEH